jgi:hypothetical protein
MPTGNGPPRVLFIQAMSKFISEKLLLVGDLSSFIGIY